MEEQNLKNIVESVVNQVVTEYTINDVTLHAAVKLIEKIEAKAEEISVNAVIAVVNKAARPIAIHCMDDSIIASYEIAVNKAYTCAALKKSTRQLQKLCQPGKELYGLQNTNEGKIVIFGGGIPITYNGRVIGGLGISGGTEEEDTFLAEYGEKLILECPIDIFDI